MAVTSQTKQDTLAFVDAFPSSHLIGDLFDLLPPEVAQQVCTVLAEGAPARVQSACNTLQQAHAVTPIQPATGSTPVDAHLTDAEASMAAGISIVDNGGTNVSSPGQGGGLIGEAGDVVGGAVKDAVGGLLGGG